MKGCFVGYDSKSKGYQIYWPERYAVSIEHNIVFNSEDSLEESIMILNEQENEKIIQNVTKQTSENEAEYNNVPQIPVPPNSPTPPEYTKQAPEPMINQPQHSCPRDVLPEPELNTRCSFQAQHEPGAYHRLNQGLDTNLVFVEGLEDELEEPRGVDYCDPTETDQFKLLDSWTLAGSMDEEPASLQEVLEGPDGAE